MRQGAIRDIVVEEARSTQSSVPSMRLRKEGAGDVKRAAAKYLAFVRVAMIQACHQRAELCGRIGFFTIVSRQLWDMLITFSLFPEPLFGGVVRLVLFTLLPAGFVAYVPARLMKAPTAADALLLAAMTAVYALIRHRIRTRTAPLFIGKPVQHIRLTARAGRHDRLRALHRRGTRRSFRDSGGNLKRSLQVHFRLAPSSTYS